MTKLGRREMLLGLTGIAACRGANVATPRGGVLAVQSGDVTPDSAVVWALSDAGGEGPVHIDWSTSPTFARARTVDAGPLSRATGLTTQALLEGLPPNEEIHYRVRAGAGAEGVGRFRTPGRRDLVFAWSGDTCGQGWGIDRARGGLRGYEAVRAAGPDLFIHCGDLIYADNPLAPEVRLPDGTVWRNLVTPAKASVAETLDELRGCYAYNFLDEHVRRLHAEVPVVGLWDDHEVHNNWWPGQTLADGRYHERRASVLAERSRRAFLEFVPTRTRGAYIHRVVPAGPLLDVFALDERSFRAKNGENREPAPGPTTAFLGRAQLDWLKAALLASRATWKVVATDMPLSLVVSDGEEGGVAIQESWANGAGPPLGREHELAELLAFVHARGITNVVFVTADVHYTAAHHYDPGRARFGPFTPFWEFVSGPLHAGSFRQKPLDETFGPEVRFVRVPPEDGLPPSAGYQFFGVGRIDARTRALTISLRDVSGATLFEVEIPPAP